MQIFESEVLYPAIELRKASRTFASPLDDYSFKSLKDFSEKLMVCSENRVIIKIFQNEGDDIFNGSKSFGLIKNAKSFASFSIKQYLTDADACYSRTLLGYFGEQFVLKATSLGLGTCWVGGTYDKKALESKLAGNDEEVICVIPLGVVSKRRSCREFFMNGCSFNYKRKRKDLEKIIFNYKDFSDRQTWVQTALNAARLAPSSFNKQPWLFKVSDRIIEIVNLGKTMKSCLDIGIVMSHLEMAINSQKLSGNWHNDDKNFNWSFELK